MRLLQSLFAALVLVAALFVGGCATHPALTMNPEYLTYEALSGRMIIQNTDGLCLVGVEDLDGRLRFLANVDGRTTILYKAWKQELVKPIELQDFAKWDRVIGVVSAARDLCDPMSRASVLMFSPYPADSLARMMFSPGIKPIKS
ncbi:MAG: hypothetical protein WC497_02930 [Patescibacteria group bacterium]